MREHLENIKAIAQELHDVPPVCYLQTIQHRLEQIVKEADAALLIAKELWERLERL